MKKIKIFMLIPAFLFLGIMISSCGNSGKSKATQMEQQAKEYASSYVCPMHCEGSGSENSGNCPSCGMTYVKNEEHTSDGHTHDHSGHNH